MSTQVVLVVAAAENGVIGAGGGMPWHLPSDLKRFKARTMGKPIVMGRKTFQAVGRPLPGRENIVISRQKDFAPEGVHIVASLDDALALARALAQAAGVDEIAVIGGGEIYAQVLPRADRVDLTLVHGVIEGDTVFPPLDPAEWREVSRHACPRGERDSHDTSFVVYARR